MLICADTTKTFIEMRGKKEINYSGRRLLEDVSLSLLQRLHSRPVWAFIYIIGNDCCML